MDFDGNPTHFILETPEVSGLVTNTVFNEYFTVFKVEKTYYDHDKHITPNKFNKFPGAIFDEKLKAKLATIASVEQRAIENDKKERKKKKIETLKNINFMAEKIQFFK